MRKFSIEMATRTHAKNSRTDANPWISQMHLFFSDLVRRKTAATRKAHFIPVAGSGQNMMFLGLNTKQANL